MLCQGKQETQKAEFGDGDANSDNRFGRHPRSSKLTRFLRGIHIEVGP